MCHDVFLLESAGENAPCGESVNTNNDVERLWMVDVPFSRQTRCPTLRPFATDSRKNGRTHLTTNQGLSAQDTDMGRSWPGSSRLGCHRKLRCLLPLFHDLLIHHGTPTGGDVASQCGITVVVITAFPKVILDPSTHLVVTGATNDTHHVAVAYHIASRRQWMDKQRSIISQTVPIV